MRPPVQTSAPAADLVSVAEAKAQMRVEETDEDNLIQRLVRSATAHLDGWSGILGRCLITQSWRQDFCDWPANGRLRLPFPDVQSITTVTYRDAADVEQTVSAALYEAGEDAIGAYVRFKDPFTSPSLNNDREYPVSITFAAGYGASASDVPEAIRHAAVMLASHWYHNRESVSPDALHAVPDGVALLIAPFRRARL